MRLVALQKVNSEQFVYVNTDRINYIQPYGSTSTVIYFDNDNRVIVEGDLDRVIQQLRE